MPEYEILRLLWWALLGVLLIGIAVMDGFDPHTVVLLWYLWPEADARPDPLTRGSCRSKPHLIIPGQ